MLKDLEGTYNIIHLGGEEYKTKFSMNCLLCFEIMYMPIEDVLKIPYTDWNRQAVVMLAYSSLCDVPGNYKAVNKRRFEDLQPSVPELERMIAERDIPLLRAELVNAILNSYPDPEPQNTATEHNYYSGEGHTRAIFCDIMGRSEKEYWRSSRREINNKINWYLEAKGLKERPVIVKQFDD